MSGHTIFSDTFEGLEVGANKIADPGDAGNIIVDRSPCLVELVSAAAETRTVKDPSAAGGMLILTMIEDEGDITLTFDSAYTEGGAVTLVLAEVGETAVFVSVKDAATTYAWRAIQTGGGAIAGAAQVNLPMSIWQEKDGTALAAFSDGTSVVPGYSVSLECFGIRWNNHGTPDPIICSFPVPADLDNSQDATLNVLAGKVGATLGDAVTWTVEAFNNVDGALYDADADYGGASSAMTGDAATKTTQLETLTLAAANLPVAGTGTITLTIQPTDGTLGTDDVILMGVWLTYASKLT